MDAVSHSPRKTESYTLLCTSVHQFRWLEIPLPAERRQQFRSDSWVVQTKEQEAVPMPDRDSLVIYDNMGPIRKLHPCIKVVEELKFLVESLTEPGEVILDCCCGLGSTLLASVQIGRRWIGCDISKKYSQIAKLRMDNLQSHKQNPTAALSNTQMVADRE